MRWRSPSRTGDKQKKALRLFKQLEFIFQDADSLTSILSLRERWTTQSPGEGQIFDLTRDADLEMKARQLLRSLGAHKLAPEIRVEWNPRLKTCAGRADYREKLISLNPLLRDPALLQINNPLTVKNLECSKHSSLTNYPKVSDMLTNLECRMHSRLTKDVGSVSRKIPQRDPVRDEVDRTLRHELAHLLAQWRVGRRRIAPHGKEWQQACRDLGIADEARCHNLPFASKSFPPRYVYRCPNCKEEFPRVRRIRRAIACLACCRRHNGGEFDARFRLKLIR